MATQVSLENNSQKYTSNMKIELVKFEKNILVSEYRFIVPFMSPLLC